MPTKAKKKTTTPAKKAPARKAAPAKEATKLLKDDHATVKALFEQLENLSDRANAKRGQLFAKLKTELEVHTKIEEEIFYPAVRALRAKEAKDQVLEANEEHALAKLLIKQLSEMQPDDETYKAKCKVLMDVVLHHAKEEEKEMFPQAKEGMELEELKELGAKMEARKEQLLSGDLGEADEPDVAVSKDAQQAQAFADEAEDTESSADDEDADDEDDADDESDADDEDDEADTKGDGAANYAS